jgi:hypothetical protein
MREITAQGVARKESLIVRPSRRLVSGRGQSIGAVGWILASFFYSLRYPGSYRVVIVCMAVAIAVGIVVYMQLSRIRMHLKLTGGQLIFSGLLRDRVVLTEGEQGRVVHVEINWRNASARRSRLWLLINKTGKTEVGLNRAAWDDQQLEHLRESLGLPVEIVESPKRPAELRNDYPGSIPWWTAHLVVATLLAIGMITAAGFVLQLMAP